MLCLIFINRQYTVINLNETMQNLEEVVKISLGL